VAAGGNHRLDLAGIQVDADEPAIPRSFGFSVVSVFYDVLSFTDISRSAMV
jgi:hypothetical protein